MADPLVDELGRTVTQERVDALLEHIMFRSDTEAWEVGLLLKAIMPALAAANAAREAAEKIVQAIRADLMLGAEDDVSAAVNRLLVFSAEQQSRRAAAEKGYAAAVRLSDKRLDQRDAAYRERDNWQRQHSLLADDYRQLQIQVAAVETERDAALGRAGRAMHMQAFEHDRANRREDDFHAIREAHDTLQIQVAAQAAQLVALREALLTGCPRSCEDPDHDDENEDHTGYVCMVCANYVESVDDSHHGDGCIVKSSGALLAPAAEHVAHITPTESGWRADCSCGWEMKANGGGVDAMWAARRQADEHLVSVKPAADPAAAEGGAVLRTVATDGHIVACCAGNGMSCGCCSCDSAYRSEYALKTATSQQQPGERPEVRG